MAAAAGEYSRLDVPQQGDVDLGRFFLDDSIVKEYAKNRTR